ncbi:hypothetical protein SBOR_7617 [Sclerotinia borealis F-4128]|uniref:F-box domain-containing protein n=1 Tax=Sclerotinia borealis (strain F-4128) TaxID=1432307 RepID=W9C5G9_SCLBF|nr:hypothetical protein SBOR_7617 [Sclerotinia borealis F-4128]
MSITNLSTELLQNIYECCDLIDILHLSQTSRKNRDALRGQYIPLLRRALDDVYGPIPGLVKLVISDESKARSVIGTGIRRNAAVDRILQVSDEPHLSIQLMSKMIKFGRVASRWVEIFPQFRWRHDYQNRRFLWPHEQRRLRRAIYHYWTYGNLFHDRIYNQFDQTSPSEDTSNDPRLRLMTSYTTIEMVQLNEYIQHVVKLIEIDLYPSDLVIQSQHNLTSHEVEKIAWGYGDQYRDLVKDLLKYTPLDLVYLYDQTSTKLERAEYMFTQGFAFNNAPATLDQALTCVTQRRRSHAFDSKDFSSSHPFATHQFHLVMYQSHDSCVQGENVKFGIADHPDEESYSNDHLFNNDGEIVLSGEMVER